MTAETTSTHDLRIGAATVTKRFRSWSRGEHEREWTALTLLSRHRPGLAPQPLSHRLDAEPPSVDMTRVPGEQMRRGGVTSEKARAMAAALKALLSAAPPDVLATLPPRLWHPQEAVESLRSWSAPTLAPAAIDQTVSRAYAVGAALLRAPWWDSFARAAPPAILGHADGNLDNVIWDGRGCRLVDFEDSGRSDLAWELADVVEHLSGSLDDTFDAAGFLTHFELTAAEATRLEQARCVHAFHWLLMLLPAGRAQDRNPPGTLEWQAQRFLDRLA